MPPSKLRIVTVAANGTVNWPSRATLKLA